MTLTSEELLFAAELTHTVTIPAHILHPAGDEADAAPGSVELRPLRLLDLQRIHKAARDQSVLTSVLMVQQALVEPKMSVDQVNRLHAGLVQHLLAEVNRISGLGLEGDELRQTVQAPLARACFILAREFGWTPEQCASLTMGQILLYLEMLGENREEAG
ncbi:MAG: hypothetical protein ACOX5Z_02465 [Desulfobulbus sp.]|jgi:hypothetical protein